jgi:hypothetical protein
VVREIWRNPVHSQKIYKNQTQLSEEDNTLHAPKKHNTHKKSSVSCSSSISSWLNLYEYTRDGSSTRCNKITNSHPFFVLRRHSHLTWRHRGTRHSLRTFNSVSLHSKTMTIQMISHQTSPDHWSTDVTELWNTPQGVERLRKYHSIPVLPKYIYSLETVTLIELQKSTVGGWKTFFSALCFWTVQDTAGWDRTGTKTGKESRN